MTLRHKPGQLPIWRDANALLREVELAVRRFPRYHKYALGTDLRRQAMDVCRAIVRAARPDGREAGLKRRVLTRVSADLVARAVPDQLPEYGEKRE